MSYLVGPKGQIVIDQRIRKALGIKPGTQTIQRMVDDHVEIRFLPAEHNRSLKGVLRDFVTRWPENPEAFDEAVARGLSEEYRASLP